jgi:hypothetical protein
MPEVSLKKTPEGASIRTSAERGLHIWTCFNPFSMTCSNHGEEILIPCGRWRTCGGCGRRLQWQLMQRFLAGIESVERPYLPMFFTLTFEQSKAPDEDQAHAALRSLVGRLRYRDQLGPYGWVLHRQENGTLHYHGIAHMPWQRDDLKLWLNVIEASGFGIQNSLETARPSHARYCSRYVSTRLAELSYLRRAYSFSPKFPRMPAPSSGSSACLRGPGTLGCDWEPTVSLQALIAKA